MDYLHTFFKSVSNLFGYIALFFLLFLMLGTTLDVLFRNLFDKPITGVFELSEVSMVLIVFMGLGWTQIDDAHIRVTLLIDTLSDKKKYLANALTYFFVAIFVCLLAYPSTLEAIHSFEIDEFRWGVMQLPIWWVKIALSLGLWFMCLQFLFVSFSNACMGLKTIANRQLGGQ